MWQTKGTDNANVLDHTTEPEFTIFEFGNKCMVNVSAVLFGKDNKQARSSEALCCIQSKCVVIYKEHGMD